MEPHNTGTGGYSGVDLTDAKLTIPAGAKHIEYWFEGSRRTHTGQADRDVQYYSNYGRNFHIDVVDPGPKPGGRAVPGDGFEG